MPFVKRQNVHQTHFEDLVLLGPGGLEELDDKIEGMIDTLEDRGGKLNTTVKIDGAPALFCWSSYPGLPDNSISLKSFTRDTAANNCISSPEQIDQKYPSEDRANMREMLKYGLELAKYIPAGECWQGDCLFTKDSKKEENIDGTDYITFQPNKIIYAFSEQNPGYEEVKNADFGIAFHTIYKGEDKKQTFNVDRSRLNVPSNIYVMSPALSVDTKSFNLNQIKAHVNKLHSLESDLLSDPGYVTLTSNEDFMKNFWNTFENKTLADNKQVTIPENTFINELKDHINKILQGKANKLKTDSGKAKYIKQAEELSQMVETNSDLFSKLVKTLNEAAKIKMLLWEGFKQTKTGYDTYYKSRTKGYFKGDMEGIRMSDQDGNIVKIVDRTNFSSYNRDPDIVGGWERESLEESMDIINEEYDDSSLEEVANQYNIPVEKLEKFIKSLRLVPAKEIGPEDLEDWDRSLEESLYEDFQSMLNSGEDIMTVAFGRMSVPTIGHMKLVKFMAAKSKGVKARLYLSHKTGKVSDPLPYEDKLYWCKKAFEPMIDVVESPLNTPLMILSDIYKKDGYTGNVLYICGEDRLEEAKKWEKYNGQPDKKGNLLFDFNDFDVISAGKRDENSLDLEETVSGTMVRQCVLDGDFDRFKKLVPFDENDAEDLYEELEESFKALGALDEDLDEAVFSKGAATNPKHTYFNDVIEYIIKNRSIKLGKQGERELDLDSFLTSKKVEELKKLLNTNDVNKFNAALSDVNVKWTDIFKGTFSGVKQSDVELMIAEAFNDINNESLKYHKIAKVLADAIGYAPQTGVTIGKLENKKGGRPTQEWKELGKYGDGKIDDTPKTDLLSSDEKWRISLKEGKGSQLMSGKFNETGSEALATLNAVFNKFPDKQYKIEDVLNVEDEELGGVFNINDVLKEFYEDEFLHSKNAVISDIKKGKSGTKEQQDKLLSISRRLDLFATKLQKMCNDSTFKEAFLREAATGETKFGPNSISTANCWFVYNNSDSTAHFYDSWESFYKNYIGNHTIKILVNFKSGGSGSVPWIVIRVLE